MRERPILFSGPMVRAILAGTKTQTRRVIRWPDWIDHNRDVFAAELGEGQHIGHFKDGRVVRSMVPAYAKGDRLWVRETWRPVTWLDDGDEVCIAYRAGSDSSGRPTEEWRKVTGVENDDHEMWLEREAAYIEAAPELCAPDRPSIFMPRWACRIELDVVDVRVQRLQDISEGDAEDEGIAYHPAAKAIIDSSMWTWTAAFAEGWDAINGKRLGCTWLDNPWVWAITFRRLP